MSPDLEALLVLQERDQRIHTLEAEVSRLPVEEGNVDQMLKRQLLRLQTLKEEAQQAEISRKKLEVDVLAKKDLIAKYRGQQLQTRKNEEFAALNHEIEQAEKDIVALEDQELDLMARYEQAQKAVAVEQVEAKKHEEQAVRLKADLGKKKAAVTEQLAEIRTKQKDAEATVSEGSLGRYRRIMLSKKDVAVVPVRHGACGGCHMKLTLQTVIAAQKDEALASCENCGRILYFAEN